MNIDHLFVKSYHVRLNSMETLGFFSEGERERDSKALTYVVEEREVVYMYYMQWRETKERWKYTPREANKTTFQLFEAYTINIKYYTTIL